MMPASTQRAHFDPSWKGDRLSALDEVARRPLGKDGIRAVDCNFQWAWHRPGDHSKGGVAYCLHWSNPGPNNYRWLLVDAKRCRQMTQGELARPIWQWAAEDVSRWRRSSSPNSERPPTYAAMVRKAVKVHVVITAELKSSAFGEALPAAQVVRTAKRAGHPPWFMALYGAHGISMSHCRQKCQSVIRAGGQFAVIMGKYRRLIPLFRIAVKRWNPPPTRTWF